jgi:1-acylglycerone phosphate reductase
VSILEPCCLASTCATCLTMVTSGRTHTHPATDIDMDDVRETFETNVFGVFATCKAFSDQLIKAKGLIINIASLSAVTPYPFGSIYTASKGAVVSYSRTLRIELEPFGVRVMVAMAGTVRSQIVNRSHRTLPAGSIYQRVAHIFEWRLTFSQKNATVETSDFARQLVAAALRPEVPRILRNWFGRPDWFWAGGLAKITYYGYFLGDWFVDSLVYRMFKMNELARVLKEENRKKLK